MRNHIQRFLWALGLVVLCGLLLPATAEAALDVKPTAVYMDTVTLPTNVARLDLSTLLRFEPLDALDTVRYTILSGEDVVTVDGYFATPRKEGFAVAEAALDSDPSISCRFFIKCVPPEKAVNICYVNTDTSFGIPSYAYSGAFVFAPKGDNFFYPVTYDGYLDYSQPIPRQANGLPDLPSGWNTNEYYLVSDLKGLEQGKTYDAAVLCQLQSLGYHDGFMQIQVGDRVYLNDTFHFDFIGALPGRDLKQAFVQSIAQALDVPDSNVRLRANSCTVNIPRDTWACSEPGGTLDIAKYLDPAYQNIVLFSSGPDSAGSTYQLKYQTPLLTPRPTGPVEASDLAQPIYISLENLGYYSDEVHFLLVPQEDDKHPVDLLLSDSTIPLDRIPGGLRIPACSLVHGKRYRLYAALADNECFSDAAADWELVTPEENPSGQVGVPDRFTVGTAANITLLHPTPTFSGSAQVTLTGVREAPLPPYEPLTEDTWAAQRVNPYGVFAGAAIDEHGATATVTFQDGKAQVPLTLHRAGDSCLAVDIGGLRATAFSVHVDPGQACFARLFYTYESDLTRLTLGRTRLGGGPLPGDPKLQLLDTYANPVTNDSATQVSISTATLGTDEPPTLSGTTTVTAKNGIAVFDDLAVTTAKRGLQLRDEITYRYICSTPGIQMDGEHWFDLQPLPPDGMSDTGEKFSAPDNPYIAGIEQVPAGGAYDFPVFRVKIGNATHWTNGKLGGNDAYSIPRSAAGVRTGSLGLNTVDGYQTMDLDGRSYYDLHLDGDLRLYLSYYGDAPYFGYLDLSSPPMDTTNVKCGFGRQDGVTVTGLTPGTWYIFSGYLYTTPQNGTGIYYNYQADDSGSVLIPANAFPGTPTAENLELYVQEVRETSFASKALVHASVHSIDPPAPGTRVRLCKAKTQTQTPSITAQSFCFTEAVYLKVFCAAYDKDGRFLAVRSAPMLLDPTCYDFSNYSRDDSLTFISDTCDFDFSGVSDIDHYKFFSLDLDHQTPASSCTVAKG